MALMLLRRKFLLPALLFSVLVVVLVGIASGCTNSHKTTQEGALDTPSPQATPGLIIYGYARDAAGAGVANVDIYRNYSAYPGEVIATTDADGFYQSGFYYIPGDEMVAVWAEQPGMNFEPEYYRWRHYYGYERAERNFSVRIPALSYIAR